MYKNKSGKSVLEQHVTLTTFYLFNFLQMCNFVSLLISMLFTITDSILIIESYNFQYKTLFPLLKFCKQNISDLKPPWLWCLNIFFQWMVGVKKAFFSTEIHLKVFK